MTEIQAGGLFLAVFTSPCSSFAHVKHRVLLSGASRDYGYFGGRLCKVTLREFAGAIALEAALAVISLRAQEGPQSSSGADGPTQQEDTAAKKKDKKKGKGAGDATYCTTRQSSFYSDAMEAPQPILS